MSFLIRRTNVRSLRAPQCPPRRYSSPSSSAQRSAHSEWYASMLPGMIPVALLGSAVYIGLQLLQSQLAHEKFLDEAREQVRQLEEEVDRLRKERDPQESTASSSRTSSSRWWPW